MKKQGMSKSTKYLLMVLLFLCVIFLPGKIYEICQKVRAQKEERMRVEAEQQEAARIEAEQREREIREAPLWEKARADGEWEEIIAERAIEDIGTEDIVCMDNLVLEMEMQFLYFSDEHAPRRNRYFFLFSDGSVYNAAEYFRLNRPTPYEEVYGEALNDEMWDHLDDWKCLGRISSEDLAAIKVNMWQTDPESVSYYEDYLESDPILLEGYTESDEFPLYYKIAEGRDVPEFWGKGFINIAENGENRTAKFWVSAYAESRRGMNGDIYAQGILDVLQGNAIFRNWQVERKELQKQDSELSALYDSGELARPQRELLVPQLTEEELLALSDEEFIYYACFASEWLLADVLSQQISEKFDGLVIGYFSVIGNAENEADAEAMVTIEWESNGYKDIQIFYEDENCWLFAHDGSAYVTGVVFKKEYYDIEKGIVGFELNKESIISFMNYIDDDSMSDDVHMGVYVEKKGNDYRYVRYYIRESGFDNEDVVVGSLYKNEYIFHPDGSIETDDKDEMIREVWSSDVWHSV